MRRKHFQRAYSCGLVGRSFHIPGRGAVRLAVLSRADVEAIDAEWTHLRPENSQNRHWSWVCNWDGSEEGYALLENGEVVACWCGQTTKLVQLDGCPSFRVDYLEVHPRERNMGLGSLTIGTIAWRAHELGARAVVFEAFNERRLLTFYEDAGAKRGAPGNWKRNSELVQLHLPEAVLHELVGDIDDWPTE